MLNIMKITTLLLILIYGITGCAQDESELPGSDGPVVSSFSPASGTEGTIVTVYGYNFAETITRNTLLFGSLQVQVSTATASSLVFKIPSGINPGEYRITVKVGHSASASVQLFTVTGKDEITDPDVLNFNYAIGTQSIGPSYGHTTDDRLVETAKAIQAMGSNILKISLSLSSYNLTGRQAYATLTDLVRDDPSFREVLDMPFNYYFFWARSHANWKDGYSTSERKEDSTQIAGLTAYLLNKYNNSGKQFFLGHWEGDWYLLDNYDANYIPSDERINGMIQWYIARQNAVDAAIKATVHSNVNVYTYAEVNRVVDAINGKRRVVSHVLPFTNVDYVSYSSYDSQSLGQTEYNNVLNYIEGNLPPRPHITGKRVFIGEMGRSAQDFGFNPSQHEVINRENIRKSIAWGTPFVLYWEMYNNEIKDGVQRGFWLIDDKNVKWPLYFTYRSFYEKAKNWVAGQKKKLNRMPSREEYNQWAKDALSNP